MDFPIGTAPWYYDVLAQVVTGMNSYGTPETPVQLKNFVKVCVESEDALQFYMLLQNCSQSLLEDFYPKVADLEGETDSEAITSAEEDIGNTDSEAITSAEEAIGNAAIRAFTQFIKDHITAEGRYDPNNNCILFDDEEDDTTKISASLEELVACLFCVCSLVNEVDPNVFTDEQLVDCPVCAANNKDTCKCVCTACKEAGLVECAPDCSSYPDLADSELGDESDGDFCPDASSSEGSYQSSVDQQTSSREEPSCMSTDTEGDDDEVTSMLH